jgi:hypothetical protein
LNGVLVNKCASGFTFCVNSIGDSTGVLGIFETDCVNIAVGGAAAIFHCVAEVRNTLTGCVEAIAEAIGDTTQLSVDILSVETFKQVRTSQCALYGCIAGAAISKQSTISENC